MDTLLEFGAAVEKSLSVGRGADGKARNSKQAYRFAEGELSGCINVALWHAIGFTVSVQFVIHVGVLNPDRSYTVDRLYLFSRSAEKLCQLFGMRKAGARAEACLSQAE